MSRASRDSGGAGSGGFPRPEPPSVPAPPGLPLRHQPLPFEAGQRRHGQRQGQPASRGAKQAMRTRRFQAPTVAPILIVGAAQGALFGLSWSAFATLPAMRERGVSGPLAAAGIVGGRTLRCAAAWGMYRATAFECMRLRDFGDDRVSNHVVAGAVAGAFAVPPGLHPARVAAAAPVAGALFGVAVFSAFKVVTAFQHGESRSMVQ